MERRKIILYVATSLDGYIARENGEIDWLLNEKDYRSTGIIESVDTIILGNRTYKQALSYDEFPYKEKNCYVFTKTIMGKNEDVTFINDNFGEFMEELRQQKGGNILLMGGTRTMELLTKDNLVNEMIVCIHPIILGSGVGLFKKYENEIKLSLLGNRAFDSGLVQLHYRIDAL